MSCLNPRKGFIVGTRINGKKNIIIQNYAVKHLEQLKKDGPWVPSYYEKISPSAINSCSTYIEIPCGKCKGCLLDHSKEWANRCLLEMKEYDSNYFLTLTYDEDHMPVNELGYKTIRKEDLTNFIKRLRKATKQNFRYFACQEYGEESKNPHAHIILFGLKLNDLHVYGNYVGNNASYWNSDVVSKCWKFGFHLIANADYGTAAYTARYVMKKLNNDYKNFFDDYQITPEYICMSRMPGLGKSYFDKHKDMFDYETIHVSSDNGGITFTPPRYFEKLAEKEGIDISKIKESRLLFAKERKYLQLKKTDEDYINMLNSTRKKFDSLTKEIKRKGV